MTYVVKKGSVTRLLDSRDVVSRSDGVCVSGRTVASPSWTDEERAQFGVFPVSPQPEQSGRKKIVTGWSIVDGVAVEEARFEDLPTRATEMTRDQRAVKLFEKCRGSLPSGMTVLVGLRYPVAIESGFMRIGCERHDLETWRNITDEQLMKMDGKNAVNFWHQYRDMLLGLAGKLE